MGNWEKSRREDPLLECVSEASRVEKKVAKD